MAQVPYVRAIALNSAESGGDLTFDFGPNRATTGKFTSSKPPPARTACASSRSPNAEIGIAIGGRHGRVRPVRGSRTWRKIQALAWTRRQLSASSSLQFGRRQGEVPLVLKAGTDLLPGWAGQHTGVTHRAFMGGSWTSNRGSPPHPMPRPEGHGDPANNRRVLQATTKC